MKKPGSFGPRALGGFGQERQGTDADRIELPKKERRTVTVNKGGVRGRLTARNRASRDSLPNHIDSEDPLHARPFTTRAAARVVNCMPKKVSEITFNILESLAKGYDLADASQNHRGALLSGGLEGVYRVRAAEERKQVLRRLLALERRRIIEMRRLGDDMILSLTKRGIGLYLQNAMLKARPLPVGKNILVLFDIPEAAIGARDHLRRFLKSAGFTKLQQSVWMTNREVGPHLNGWRQIDPSGKWVRVFMGENLM